MSLLMRLLPALAVTLFFVTGHVAGFDSRLARAVAPCLALAVGFGLALPGAWKSASPIDKALALFLALAAGGLWLWPRGLGRAVAFAPEAWLYAVLMLRAAVPLLLGREPFTMFFARRRTPEHLWGTPQFAAINRHMTWAWAGLFLACALLAALPPLWPAPPPRALALLCRALLPPALLLGLGLPLNRRYPAYYLRRAGLDPERLRQPAPAPAPAPAATPPDNPDASVTPAPAKEDDMAPDTAQTMAQDQARPAIVALNGSPHAGIGNTSLMLEMMRPVLEAEGFALEVINLAGRNIQYCLGCAFCMEKGQCWIDDEHRAIAARLLAAPAVILASPVYFMHVTAQMKTFIDRSLALGHKPRGTWKPGLALSVSAGLGETDVAEYLGKVLKTYGAFPVGSLTAIAVTPGGFLGQEAVAARAADLARDLARAVKEKRRYPATERDLYYYLFMGNLVRSQGEGVMRDDHEHWQKLGLYQGFTSYVQQEFSPGPTNDEARQAWIRHKIAEQKARRQEGGAAPVEPAPPAAAPAAAPAAPAGPQAASTCRELLALMPLGFNPAAAGELAATVQFEVSGTESFTAHLVMGQGRCEFREGAAEKPDLVIQTPAEVWLGIARGELDGQSAFMQGRYQVRGDFGLLMRFKTLFSK